MAVDDFRPWHYLRVMGRCTVPRRLCFFDCETYPECIPGFNDRVIHKFRMACSSSGRWENGKLTRKDSRIHYTPDDLWRYIAEISSKDGTLWVFAHNLGFDLSASCFWQQLENGKFTFDGSSSDDKGVFNRAAKWPGSKRGYIVLNDPPTIISMSYRGRRIMMVDSLNYFSASLAAIGDEISCLKLPMPKFNASNYDWAEYCMNDVLILEKAVCELISWWEEGGYGPWAPTAAGLAVNAYRGSFMTDKSILIHGDATAISLERHAYFGGQTIAAYVGEIGGNVCYHSVSGDSTPDGIPTLPGPVHVLDVTSLYPFIMKTRKLPCALSASFDYASVDDIVRIGDNLGCIAHVTLDSPTDPFPVRLAGNPPLPIMDGNNPCFAVSPYVESRPVYARGSFTTVLCGPELDRAIRDRRIKDVKSVAFYDMAKLFDDYIDEFWNERINMRGKGLEIWERFAKLMLNSLWGKFGQRSGLWKDDNTVAPIMPWGTWSVCNVQTQKSTSYRSVAWRTQRQTDREETANSFPAISAFITSCAREYMRLIRSKTGDRNWYYQDTDSLHVNEEGLRNLKLAGLVEDDEMGKLHYVGVYDTARYYGPKRYRIGEQWVISGVKAKAHHIEGCHWRQREFSRLPGTVSDRPPSGVIESQRNILLCQHTDDQLHSPDGWTAPFTL